MDIVMPEVDGVEAIRRIVRTTPTARIIVLTMYREEPYMLAAIRAGARGYLLKTVDAVELVAAIEAVHRGDYLIDPIIAARARPCFSAKRNGAAARTPPRSFGSSNARPPRCLV